MEKKDNSFISKNVWLNRLGLVILLVGMFPAIAAENTILTVIIITSVVIFALIAFFIKIIRAFFKTFI
jgi:uncharacterized membrane protein